MSIGTDVARIKGNIAAALAAIADKGVTVPDGSTSDALAGLIASIEAGGGGGGLPEPFSKFETGTFLLSKLAYANAYPITHGLGIAPKVFLIMTAEPGSYSGGSINHLCYIDDVNTNITKIVGHTNSKDSIAGWSNRSYVLADENTFTFNNSNSYFGSNRMFRWVAIA